MPPRRCAALAVLLLLLGQGALGQEPPPEGFGRGLRRPPHGSQKPPEMERLDRLIAQLDGLEAPAAARLEGLGRLRAGYTTRTDFDALLSERAELTRLIDAEIASSEAILSGARAAYAEMLRQGRLHVKEVAEFGENAGPFPAYKRSIKKMSGLPERLRAARAEDEAAYLNADVPERRKRRSLLFLGGGLAGAALLGYAFVAIQRQTIAKAVQDATQTALASQAPPVAGRPAASMEAGRVIGDNFQIERLLGAGGMGVVYLATDLTLRRRVAIKRMRDELVDGGADSEAFLNEARLVAALRHPNIVEILSIVKEPGILYLVFEYVEGRSLREWIGPQNRIALPGVKSVLHQVCQGLDYAHGRQIVHRDLKPANVMVDARGVAKVMDFGIAHRARATLAKATQTDASGTPAYMAPEQVLGSASRASDVFSAGVCLYEMLTGRLPYDGPDLQGQKTAMRFAPPSSFIADLPRGVDEVAQRALAADPARRYASAGELAQAFLTL
ncbi:MAG: serine/threonine protein kinase [Elusimicrobia bacterium]|nr:serine/threonine protein kinase [Elusimicrobiota bacterium]